MICSETHFHRYSTILGVEDKIRGFILYYSHSNCTTFYILNNIYLLHVITYYLGESFDNHSNIIIG